MKKVLAILLAVALVSFAVPSLADPPKDLDASLTIGQPSGVDGIVWNNHETCCAEQSMIDLSIESLSLSWNPVFNDQLIVDINIDESYSASSDATADSTATSDSDADANANATGDSDATANANTSGEGEAIEIAGAGALSGSGAVAGAGALAMSDSEAEAESETEVEADFDSDTDIDIDIDWMPTYGIAGELLMENVVLLAMQQSGGHESCVGAAVSMVGDADLDLEANNVFIQEQVQRPVFDGEGVLVGASGVQQQASQSYTKLTINSAGSVPVLDGSITYNEGLGGL